LFAFDLARSVPAPSSPQMALSSIVHQSSGRSFDREMVDHSSSVPGRADSPFRSFRVHTEVPAQGLQTLRLLLGAGPTCDILSVILDDPQP